MWLGSEVLPAALLPHGCFPSDRWVGLGQEKNNWSRAWIQDWQEEVSVVGMP